MKNKQSLDLNGESFRIQGDARVSAAQQEATQKWDCILKAAGGAKVSVGCTTEMTYVPMSGMTYKEIK